MKEAILLHGAYGSPNENWFSWLKKELERKGYTVFVPTFSTLENQNLQQWTTEFWEQIGTTSGDTILITHSLGAAFAAKILEDHEPYAIKACFFIAPFCSNLAIQQFDSINSTFIHREFNWSLVQKNGGELTIFGSTNAPYVSKQHIQEFAENCVTQPIWIDEAGHFNESAGFSTFPLLLEGILRLS